MQNGKMIRVLVFQLHVFLKDRPKPSLDLPFISYTFTCLNRTKKSDLRLKDQKLLKLRGT